MPSLKLTELIDVKVLQRIQDGFSKYTGMAALTTDADGMPVTNGSNFTDFCINLRAESAIGYMRCMECDKKGALLAQETGKAAVYTCHAGLVDYAAPIKIDGVVIGSFLGGQIRTEELDEELMRKTAADLEIDEDRYLVKMRETAIINKEDVERAAEFLYDIAQILSEMAYNNYKALQKSRRLERAARSQTAYIMDMNEEMQSNMQDWMQKARKAMIVGDFLDMRQVLRNMLDKGPGLLASIEDTVEYAKMTDGEIELNETEYDIEELLQHTCKSIKKYELMKNVKFQIEITENVPKYMLGDAGRIGQVVSKILLNSPSTEEESKVHIKVSCEKKSYAVMLYIDIYNYDCIIEQDEIENINKYIKDGMLYMLETNEEGELGFTIVGFLLRQMNGTLDISSTKSDGTVFSIKIPQLKIHV